MNRSLEGLVGALLAAAPEAGSADRAAGVPQRLDRLLDAMPRPARTGFRGAAGLLDAYAVVRTGRRLDRLTADEREALVTTLPDRLLDLVKMPVILAAGTEQMLRRRTPGTPVRRPPDDPPLDCVPSASWPDRHTADVVIIGSGAGGAVAARTFARAGLRVIVIEEGRHHTTADFRAAPPLDRFTELYRDGGATIMMGDPPILLPTGRAVGGTTVINSGTCYRTPHRVLTRWHTTYGIDLAEPSLFAADLDDIERTLRVAPAPLDILGHNGTLTLEGARRLGWKAAPLRRNAPGCQGSCACVVGCPTGAKQSVQLSVLPDACAAGARIITSAHAEAIMVDRDLRSRPRAAGVVARRPDGTRFEILSPLVAVAAGALMTPLLLRRSHLAGHRMIGRNLAVHPAVSVGGRFDGQITGGPAVLQSAAVEELHDDGILIEATAPPPGMSSFLLPGAGRRLRAEMEGQDSLATVGAMIADRPGGRVWGRRRPTLTYRLAQEDAHRLIRAIEAVGRLLLAAGAREVLTGVPATPGVRTAAELSSVRRSVSARQLHLSAFHPTGTVAMGADPDQAPADSSGWLRGVDGVLVTDASALPSCPEVNPQVTVMATAQAVSRTALNRL
ncbi:GMC family oxidoreductase N-terminal domain-containing protein [Streptomyces sp. NPDC059582]|uniref:GMC family oxidoreductase N-terminal domain-containing protein n=1 Tax=Streptomyces sp. NPDC059582 TaxID=3346875 RepID=UPI0036901B8B